MSSISFRRGPRPPGPKPWMIVILENTNYTPASERSFLRSFYDSVME